MLASQDKLRARSRKKHSPRCVCRQGRAQVCHVNQTTTSYIETHRRHTTENKWHNQQASCSLMESRVLVTKITNKTQHDKQGETAAILSGALGRAQLGSLEPVGAEVTKGALVFHCATRVAACKLHERDPLFSRLLRVAQISAQNKPNPIPSSGSPY